MNFSDAGLEGMKGRTAKVKGKGMRKDGFLAATNLDFTLCVCMADDSSIARRGKNKR